MQNAILISKDLYDKLYADHNLLSCLQACGVDNWVGYDEALEAFHTDYPEDKEHIA